MERKAKVKFGKGVIIVIVLSMLTIAVGVACVAMLSQNKSVVHLFGGVDNVYESAHLEEMAIDGYKIGDAIVDHIQDCRTQGSDYDYYCDGAAYWEQDGRIAGIGFYANTKAIDEANITYEGRFLVKIDDFEETFGVGEERTDKNGDKIITYRQGDYRLNITVRNDVIYSVVLLKELN